MAKVEVQIRRCCCCGLSMGTVSIAIYCIILYALLTALAAWGLSDTNQYGDSSHYNSCELEAQGKINADNRKLVFSGGHTTVVVEDSTSYHCSFGLYTEELKYSSGPRNAWLIFDIFIYVSMIFTSFVLLCGIARYNQWALVPWLVVMLVDIIRGLISVFFIFWFSHGNLARIATGIFFLGLQIFHMSMWVLIVAKFQRIYNIKAGNFVDQGRPYDPRAYGGPAPSTYAYSPDMRRGDFYPPPPPSSHHPEQMVAPPLQHQQQQQGYYGRDPYGRY